MGPIPNHEKKLASLTTWFCSRKYQTVMDLKVWFHLIKHHTNLVEYNLLWGRKWFSFEEEDFTWGETGFASVKVLYGNWLRYSFYQCTTKLWWKYNLSCVSRKAVGRLYWLKFHLVDCCSLQKTCYCVSVPFLSWSSATVRKIFPLLLDECAICACKFRSSFRLESFGCPRFLTPPSMKTCEIRAQWQLI